MAGLRLPFTALSIDADEHYPARLSGGDIPAYISRAKAQAYADRLAPDELLITADTIVWAEGQMLGKPHSEQEAFEMLRILSGKTHQVYTAVTFARRKSAGASPMPTNEGSASLETIVDCTDVTFKVLTDEEIGYYIEHYRPYDKAGAYGIQEWIGYIACTAIQGSYFNVMGLPIHRVYQELKKLHIV